VFEQLVAEAAMRKDEEKKAKREKRGHKDHKHGSADHTATGETSTSEKV
jgi:hypothetical protein